MSSLQKSIMKNKLPPRCPKTSGKAMLAPFGGGRRKVYTPVSWKTYFDRYEDVETDAGTFRVYLSKDPEHPGTPRIVTLHGGGYSGLTWALFTEEITSMVHCQVVSIDLRGHGETQVKDSDDLNIDTLVTDVESVLHKLFPELPALVLLGHSMGGAVATRVAHQVSLENALRALAVIDVVEGTAMEALASMQSFLRSRPTHFKSIEHAIEWCVRSGQVRNVDSVRVSMPSQIVNCETGKLATHEVDNYTSTESADPPSAFHPPPPRDSIAEEDESAATDRLTDAGSDRLTDAGTDRLTEGTDVFVKPTAVGDGASAMKYKWRIELSRTESHWARWFAGLSQAFLSAPAPRLLLLANIDGLDTQLIVGQMQGKFQMQVLPRCGHAVHEDNPTEVARAIASFMLRHQLTTARNEDQRMQLVDSGHCFP